MLLGQCMTAHEVRQSEYECARVFTKCMTRPNLKEDYTECLYTPLR
jgi:hypothetical protein